ncbi:MAG: 5'-nucleotidase C-terminal domain-containing protein [Ignavibacteriae bacterium]|nr:5'-nucleotidase C-terminal domain-containing protein [Ignavibacteriota bacterium]
MKKFFPLVICLLLIINSRIFSEDITILFATDTHSNLSPGAPRTPDLAGTKGGIARAATYIKQVRMEDPGRMTLLLHGGDAFVGDVFFNVTNGLRELNAMKMLGYDAMVLGNHEFDLGSNLLPVILNTTIQLGFRNFPIICSNLNSKSQVNYGLDTVVIGAKTIEQGNVNVGIFGLTTPKTNFYTQTDIIDGNLDSVVAANVAFLKSLNCNIIICLSHMGDVYDRQIAQNVEGIDLIIGGHDHKIFPIPETFDHNGKNTYYVQAGAFYRTMGRVNINYNNNQIENLDYDFVNIDENIEEDPDMKHFIDSLEEDANNSFRMNCFTEQIATAEDNFWESNGDLLTEGFKDTPVGNLVTDAFLNIMPEADIAIVPCGSTAQPLYTGPVVANDIFRMIGYGFNYVDIQHYKLATFDLLGIQLLGGLQIALKEINLDDELFIQCSGLEYAYYTNHDPTDRLILDSVKINGQPVKADSIYKIVTNEFVAQLFAVMLGSQLPNLSVSDTISEFDAVMFYLNQNPVITPVSEGRVKAVVDPNIGVEEITGRKPDFKVYPNPAKGIVNFSFEITEPGIYSMKIFNSMGQEISEILNYTLETGSHSKILDVSDFPDGLYLVKLTNGRINKSVNLLVN